MFWDQKEANATGAQGNKFFFFFFGWGGGQGQIMLGCAGHSNTSPILLLALQCH